MMAWWSNMAAVAALNNLILVATVVCAVLTGIFVFLFAGKSKGLLRTLSNKLEKSRTRLKSLETTAGVIRKELLETQQHQDIDQLKLKSTTSSAEEQRQELLNARKRLEVAEAAIKAHKAQASREDDGTEATEMLELELEEEGGLSENQREQLIDLLDPGPKGNVDIFCIMGDKKSELTAKRIEEVLTADGWKTNGVAKSAFSNPPNGLVLAVNNKETAPSYASFLQRVFSTIGMTVSAKIDNKYREWSLSVIVGTIDS